MQSSYAPGSELSIKFVNSPQYTQRYQRNNKRSGLKNLRCFPHCAEEGHKLRGFCGAPVRIQISNPRCLKLRSWGIITKIAGGDRVEGPNCASVGDVMSFSEIVTLTRCKADPFRPWIEGQAHDGKMGSDQSCEDSATIFSFNHARKGWHYGWVANKHTCDSEHVLRAYLFEEVSSGSDSDPSFKLVGSADSPRFTIFCRRRQRQNLDKLPVQLKMQLEMQDKLKNEINPTAKMPRAIVLDKAKPRMVHGSEMVLKNATQPAPKRKAVKVADGGDSKKAKRARKPRKDGSVKNGAPPLPAKIEPTTYEEKKTLLFHIMRSLLRLDVRTEVPLLSTVDSNDVHIYTGSEYDNNPWGISGNLNNSTSNCGATAPRPLKLERRTSVGGNSTSTPSAAFDTKSISDVMDVFSTNDSDLINDAQSIALSATRSNAGLDLPNLNDFEPFDIDFSALGDTAGLNTIHGPGSRKKNFVEIMKEYAVFLLGEEYFTTTIESALSSLGGSSPDQCKVVAVAVLLDLLKTFLGSYNVTLDELYHLFRTQVWEKDDNKQTEVEVPVTIPDPSQHEAASAMIKLGEKQIIISRPPPMRSEKEANAMRADAEVAFMEHIAHYTATIREAVTQPSTLFGAQGMSALGRLATSVVSSSSFSNILPLPRSLPLSRLGHGVPTAATTSMHAGSSLGRSAAGTTRTNNKAITLASLMAEKASAAVPSPASLSPNPLPVIPENNPINDLTGHWYRPEETLDVLEGIREAIGVPWVLRKMMRYMETNLELSHVPGCMDSQSNRKLLSSGFQRYILDGKQHEWVLPPPIPTERPQRNAFYKATIIGGVLRLELWYTLKKRIVRETRKSTDGQSLDSIVHFQFREDVNGEWQDKIKARCRALRCEPKSKDLNKQPEQPNAHHLHQSQNHQQQQQQPPMHYASQPQQQPQSVPHGQPYGGQGNYSHYGNGDDVGWLSTAYDDFALNLS